MADYPDPDDYPSPDLRPFMSADVATRELPDFEAEGMLEGLEGADREARIKLLTELWIEDGADLETLKAEIEANRLALLPADLVLGRTKDKYTPQEIAELAGLTVADFQNLIAAIGLPRPAPGERRFDDADLLAARRLRRFRDPDRQPACREPSGRQFRRPDRPGPPRPRRLGHHRPGGR